MLIKPASVSAGNKFSGRVITALFFGLGIVWANTSAPLVLPRLNGSIQLDGQVDDPAWELIDPLPLTKRQPTFGGDPSEKTEIRIAYDDDYIYASGRFYMTDPDRIQGNSLVRDGGSINEDGFVIILDTFNDNETAVAFVTTPTGLREDMTIGNDGQPRGRSSRGSNKSWNTYWDVAVTRSEDGWFAEMRIPFTSLRFQDEDGRVVMGLSTWRRIASKNEVVTFPAIDPKWTWGLFQPSMARDVVLEGIYSRSPLWVTSYALGGLTQEWGEADGSFDAQPSRNVGLDAKYGLTSNLTLDLTLNTDFAQAEVDDEQVNLTRFSLFYPEKRQFFLERSSTFDFFTGPTLNVFYSRRIGLSKWGPVPILGGARLVGRMGGWDLAVLNMQTGAKTFTTEEEGDTLVPGENFGVVRIKRQVLNDYSTVGAILTSRQSGGGAYDYVYGLDAQLRPFGDDYMQLLWAHNLSSANKELYSQDSLGYRLIDAGRLRGLWERRSSKGIGYQVIYSRRGAIYDPGIGYENRSDYTYIGPNISYSWLPESNSPIYRMTLTFQSRAWWRNGDLRNRRNKPESTQNGSMLRYTGRSGSSASLTVTHHTDDLIESFDLPGDTEVAAGKYSYNQAQLFYRTPSNRLISVRFQASGGSFYDGQLFTLGISPSWVISRHYDMRARYTYNLGSFDDERGFTAHVLQLRFNANLNTALSSSLFFQINSDQDEAAVNFRLRYNPREGTDFYLVLNQGLVLHDETLPDRPLALITENKAILLKYATTFIF